ncbi:unnamed protein product [Caenorhabditis sp. 36 PRJEB53466]|nr:unnamed protein product [Caenorhabditis sp. 36 PRJEB53466]
MQSSTVFFGLLIVLSCLLLSADAQFFFPFGMGQNNVAPSNYNNNYGATYGSGYGVKDSEGFFTMCKGWTCQN